ncbi:ribosome hibernation-promoting factor, HPF/YfiA family [Dethiothermospora halolimnae]|uniref:ribosome hibernation-promoting factor, HPF/YfiA family n=1 Tax=Dethiothermospora halolimnae TaxID=3114390 RepID=UPI003CCBDF54
MKLIISGKNMQVTDGLRNAAEKKLTKLDKYFNQDVEVNTTLSVEKDRHIAEVTIPFSGTILRAEEYTDDMYASIDKVVDILERQVRKHKTKLQKRHRNGDTIRFENIPQYPKEDNEPKIVKTKRFAMKPMDEEEAVLQMELLRHSFFVFRNADTDEVNVVYKRKDGNYGLIEPMI